MKVEACAEACPDELQFSEPVRSAIGDPEILVRFISDPGDLLQEEDGPRVSTGHFSSKDINGKIEKGQRRAVSAFRLDFMGSDEARKRAAEKSMCDHPLVATASAQSIRSFLDEEGRRELCVYADCSDPTATFPPSPLHASIRKSEKASTEHQRQEILIYRMALSDAFRTIYHLVPGFP